VRASAVLAAVVLATAAPARASPPAAAAPLPRTPAALAAALARSTAELRLAIDGWRASGDPTSGGPPRSVTLWALRQQRLYRKLSASPALARATIARLPAGLVSQASDTVAARRELARLATPRPASAFRTGPPQPAGVLLRHYRAAERRFGVSWQLLAAVNFVESAFGRLRSASSAGAQGPMQFLPATWRAYGLGGDVHDPHDAILGAANYLRANGAARDARRGLYAYNHSIAYVDAVLRYARQLRRDPRAYFAYYSWQVFVRTPSGDRRLTGPGLRG
jgi:membrane-bound lytic murein transglycosylase B